MSDFLKRWQVWLFLWLVFFGLILLCPVGHAKLKTFFKAYPWGNTDTTTVANQREIAWERSKGFTFCLEGMADLPGAIRLLYDRPVIIMYHYTADTEAFNAQSIIRPGKIDSMYAWINRNGYLVDSCYLHWDSLRIWASKFYQAYDDSNDLNSDGIRDFDSFEGLATRYGVNWAVDTSADWIVSEWIGQGVYEIDGDFIDTVLGNSSDSVWWNVGDTTNLVTNSGFETGDSLPTGWTRHGSGRLLRTTETALEDSYSVKVNGTAGYGDVAVKQLSIQTPLHCLYVFQASYKTNADFTGGATHVKLGVVRAGDESYGLSGYYVPSESADGSWHTYRDTFSNYESGSWRDSMVIYLGIFPTAEGDTTWNANDSIYFDRVKLFPLNGSVSSWSSTGDFGENVTYYPFIIDSLDIYNHTATAQSESLARCQLNIQYDVEVIANIGYTGYRAFQKWWSAKIFDVRASEGFDGIFEDEMWGTAPIPHKDWSAEYEHTGLAYPGVPSPMNRDSIWMRHYLTLLESVHDTLHSLNKYVFINIYGDTEWVKNVDGFLPENQDDPIYGQITSTFDTLKYGFANYPYTGRRSNLWRYDQMRDLGKICLWFTWDWNTYEQGYGSASELATRYDTTGQQGALSHIAEFESTFIGRSRARVASLAQYYLIESDSTYYWYEINNGYLPREYYWAGIQDVDIGNPVDSTFEFASGYDDSLIPYTIAGRKFYGGETGDTVLVLYKPKSYGSEWWGCYTSPPCTLLTRIGGVYNIGDSATWDIYPATTHALGGTYVPLDWTGKAGTPEDSVSLRFNEGAILIRISCD